MSNLKITLNPYDELNTASLDGAPLSAYSEISNYLKKPFISWAGDLLDAVERETNDNFDLTVVSERFEAMFLDDLQGSNASCCSFKRERFLADFLVDKRFDVVRKLADKYRVPYSLDEYYIPTYVALPHSVENEMLKSADEENAFLKITDKEPDSCQCSALTIFVSNRNDIKALGDGKYIWEIDKSRLNDVIDAIVERFSKIPFINKVAQKTSECKVLESSDKELLSLATSITPLLKVKNIDKIEVGETIELDVEVFPKTVQIPPLRITYTNANVISVDGLKITALNPGETEISIFKADEGIPFDKKKVTVFYENLVKRIALDRPDPNMCIGRTQKIDLSVVPQDAEDKDFIVWSVDNSNIISVDLNGVVTAKSAGRAVVTASTPKVKESVIIDVLPNISKITLSMDEIKVLKGETVPITVSCEPTHCYNNGFHWTTDDSNVAQAETLPDSSNVIRAKEPGCCTLTCVADEGGCSSICRVEVLDPDDVKASMKKKLSTVEILCIIGIPVLLGILASIVGSIVSFFS